MADICVTGCGSYRVESLSEEGADWMWDNVVEAEEEESGGVMVAYLDSAIYTQDIMDGATEEGLEVWDRRV
jgi:hypothetical protein